MRPWLEDPEGATAGVWPGLVELGVPGLLVPEACGGAGLGMVEAGIVAEELGAVVFPGPWPSSGVAATRLLARLGADGEGGELLRALATGERIATVGPLEPGTARPAATARGAATELSGAVESVADADVAGTLLVLAEVGGGSELFAVERDSAAVGIEAEAGVDPTRRSFRVELRGAPGRGLGSVSEAAVQALLDEVLIVSAAEALGAARAVFEQCVVYAGTREQFGQPIGAFQAVQHLCVDMYETLELARSGVIHALWAADVAEPAARHLAAVRAKGLLRATGGGGGDRHPGLRRHRVHLGARRPSLPEAAAALERPRRRLRSLPPGGRLAPGQPGPGLRPPVRRVR